MSIHLVPDSIAAPLAGLGGLIATSQLESGVEWVDRLVGPASGLFILIAVVWFLKGYYDKALTREGEDHSERREFLEKLIAIATIQQEQAERTIAVIADNARQTEAATRAMDRVSKIVDDCEKVQMLRNAQNRSQQNT